MGLRKNSRSVSEKTFNTKLLQYNRLQCDVSYILLEAVVEIHSLLVRQSRNKYGKYIFCCKHSNIIFYSDVIILNEKLPATTTITTRCWPCFILKTNSYESNMTNLFHNLQSGFVISQSSRNFDKSHNRVYYINIFRKWMQLRLPPENK